MVHQSYNSVEIPIWEEFPWSNDPGELAWYKLGKSISATISNPSETQYQEICSWFTDMFGPNVFTDEGSEITRSLSVRDVVVQRFNENNGSSKDRKNIVHEPTASFRMPEEMAASMKLAFADRYK